MSVSRLVCLAGLTLWRVLAVAGVVLLIMLPPSPSPPSSLQRTRNCDRKLSSVARRIIHQTLMPVITQLTPEVRLPFQCPLHPLRDVYGLAELSKLNYRVNLWTCAHCGKSFTGEFQLETHIHHRHPSLWAARDFTVCLADWCDVLRCDLQEGTVLRRPWPVREPERWREKSSVARAPSRELVALLESSDPGLGLAFTCSSGQCLGERLEAGTVRPRLRRHHNNSTCKDCLRNNCNPNKMEKLKTRCEVLVDSCLSPLALQLTDKELLQLREKIEAEICSYLTCDKYWSVEDRRDRINLAAIILTLTTTAALYLIFVYHLVWSWY